MTAIGKKKERAAYERFFNEKCINIYVAATAL